jgi:hypothetical protein
MPAIRRSLIWQIKKRLFNLGIAENLVSGAVDTSRFFVPETFTPLFYTPLYAELTQQQRLRYNQLHGCYCNEQIMFFEKFIAENVLTGLIRTNHAAPLLPQLRLFLDEERRHAQMFYELNRLCLPQLYERRSLHFVKMPFGLKVLLNSLTSRSWFFPLFVWLMMLQEERAVFLGRETLRLKEEIEPHFVALQRIHLADEIGHVQWDQEILAITWSKSSGRFRKVNAAMLRRVLREFAITPKRANVGVIAELVTEFPELMPRLPQLRRALLTLGQDRDWNTSLYSRATVPKTFAFFDRWPEFSSLSRVLCGYQPAGGMHE